MPRTVDSLSLLAMDLIVVRVRCEARVLKTWYGCAASHQWQTFTHSSSGLDRKTAVIGHVIEHLLS